MTSADLRDAGVPPPRPPAPLSHPQQSNIHYDPRAARFAAITAAVFLAEPGRKRSHNELDDLLPDMGHSTVRFYLDRWRAAGWLDARPSPELTEDNGRPMGYSLTPAGKSDLEGYLRYYLRQLDDLDRALRPAAAGIPPGQIRRPGIPQLSPAEARVLLFLRGRAEAAPPCPVSQISASLTPATGMQPRILGSVAEKLTDGGLLDCTHRYRQEHPGRRSHAYMLTRRGRALLPYAAAKLRAQLGNARKEVLHIGQASPEAGR